MVGDIVEITPLKHNFGVIEKLYERKNKLIRPYVSNIDSLIIVIALLPKPDLTLVDKLIVSCYIEKIEPVLCFNKADLTDQKSIDEVFEAYKNEMPCVRTSTVDSAIGLKELYGVMKGKLSCFAGQSAVGKSSIINRIIGDEVMKVNGLSAKAQRGKHTTRHIEISITAKAGWWTPAAFLCWR